MTLHRRQFILAPRAVDVAGDWRHTEVSDGFVLSHCPSLPVTEARDVDGCTWHLLGVALQTDPARSAPEEELRRAQTAAVPDRYGDWSGRWVLIGNGQVHLDAAGLLGCFYRVEDGAVVLDAHYRRESPLLSR